MNQPQARKLTKKSDWLILGVVFIGLLLFMFLPQFFANGEQGTAVVSVDSKVVLKIDLKTAENGTFSIEELPNVVFSIESGAIAILDGDCPDKVCERTGYISRAGESIICLPNRVIIQIEGESEMDAIVR